MRVLDDWLMLLMFGVCAVLVILVLAMVVFDASPRTDAKRGDISKWEQVAEDLYKYEDKDAACYWSTGGAISCVPKVAK